VSWEEQAACRRERSIDFLSELECEIKRAKAVCGGCSVREECLEMALATPWLIGVAGGLTPAERRKIRGRRRFAGVYRGSHEYRMSAEDS
jgi:WhiB family redox-sensing transcriptional regulator